MRPQTNLQRETSMLHWWPRIKNVLPAPKTVILPITLDEVVECIRLLDGHMISEGLYDRLKSGAERIGYPLFLRTDIGSAKHQYIRTCRLDSEQDLLAHLGCLIEWHLMKDLAPAAVVFRELLDLNAPFTAFAGLPIAKERRYFVDGCKVLCHHPYWPEGAIETYAETRPLPTKWAEMLAGINEEDEHEVSCISRMAEAFSECVPGFFSVDFAQATSGKWYLIDAARGELSWHPEHGPGE